MPHVIVKLWPAKSEDQKNRLAEAITKNIIDILHYREKSVWVAIEEIKPQDWVEKVYKPEIKANLGGLYKKPGYVRMTCDSSRITGHGGSIYENTRRYTHRAFVFRGRFRTGPGTSRGRVWRCPDFVTPGFAIG